MPIPESNPLICRTRPADQRSSEQGRPHVANTSRGILRFGSRQHRPTLATVRYTVAIVAALAGGALRHVLSPLLQSSTPYITFFPAIAVSAAFGGLGPGLVTTGVGAIIALWFVISPAGSLTTENFAESLGLGLYLSVGTLISYLLDALKSERYDVKQAAERLSLVQATGRLGVLDWNLQTGAVAWSPELYELTGLSADAVRPSLQRWLECIHADDRDDAADAVERAVETEEELVKELRVLHADGTVLWLLLRARVFTDLAGAPLRFVGVHLDVTDRKQAEQTLRTLNEKLRRTNAELEQYAYAASHDLQEPLRIVDLYSQLLVRRYRDRFDPEAHTYFDYIRGGARRMQMLVSDLLSYSRLLAEMEQKYVPVDMNSVIDLAEEKCKAMLADTGGAVRHDQLPSVQGDFEELVTVFRHLISNAISYCRPSEPPVIHISAQPDGTQWRIAVQDNGIGVAPDYHQRIFCVFKRLHGGNVPGTGMGLAICRKIVEQHGGRIWVESAVGRGSTFLLTLPDARPD